MIDRQQVRKHILVLYFLLRKNKKRLNPKAFVLLGIITRFYKGSKCEEQEA